MNHAFSMLGFVSHMGIKVDQVPHSQSTVRTVDNSRAKHGTKPASTHTHCKESCPPNEL
jgi:hypothetical protein